MSDLHPVSATERLLANAAAYGSRFDPAWLTTSATAGGPAVAIVSCMDHRVDVFSIFGLSLGEAQVVRNAGGIVTDDTIRSLSISQRVLGTREVIVVHHTDCGMLRVTDAAFLRQVEEETGVRPAWEPGAFTDLDDDVRESVRRLIESPFLPAKESIRGFVYDVHTGRLREVTAV